MKVNIPPGKYILAVSGGVDSMVLLDVLSAKKSLELVVAHFDHGVRSASGQDAQFVQRKAQDYGLPFELGRGRLGAGASEDAARVARYEFLNYLKNQHEAKAIITAHHQDDLIETAFINLSRGTGPRGLVSILRNPDVLRPLINFSKQDILNYAGQHSIQWVEDATNSEDKYLRNYIRHNLTEQLTDQDRRKILANINHINAAVEELNLLTVNISQRILVSERVVDRQAFMLLPASIGNEFLRHWLVGLKVNDIDRKTIERLSIAIKTAKPGSSYDIKNNFVLRLDKQTAQITNTL